MAIVRKVVIIITLLSFSFLSSAIITANEILYSFQMQFYTKAKRMADESVDDMAAEASVIPPASPPPLIQSGPPPHQLQLLEDNAPVTAPSQSKHDSTSQPPPPPTLPKFQQQTSPILKRPDSAYGGSGGTPSLLSTVCSEMIH